MSLPNFTREKPLWNDGFKKIVGIDEVGRGSWAGPLVAAGVILSRDFRIPLGFNDSKKLNPAKRQKFSDYIYKYAIATYISEISHKKINSLGVGQCTQIAFTQIINKITPKPNYVLVDAYKIKSLNARKQKTIIKGDTISASIAAASIIAKVYRDNLMTVLSYNYPNYGFEKHKGYGTKIHQNAIRKFGFSNIHRSSFNISYLLE